MNLNIGDRLIRTKNGIFSRHHAIYAGHDGYQHWVAENQSGYGVRYLPLRKFRSEGKLVGVKSGNYSYHDQQLILARIDERLGTEYDFFTYNCEHFVNDVLFGKKQSQQVQSGVLVVGAIALVAGITGASVANS